MALTPSHRPTREWPLLILTVAIVGAICVPLWQGLSAGDNNVSFWASWTPERWGRLLLGPEQIACYCCFTWACLILLSRYLEVRRQRKAFKLPLLPVEDGARILYQDARPLQRRVEQVIRERGPFILANMIRLSLGKYALSRSSKDVSDTVRTQAEVDQGRLVTSMATVNYLAWALPAIGFLGTVRGLGGMAGQAQLESEQFTEHVIGQLYVAFDTTFVALILSIVVMLLLHTVQREEESLVIDCQQYCLEHLVNRLYEPETLDEGVMGRALFSPDLPHRPTSLDTPGTRLTS